MPDHTYHDALRAHANRDTADVAPESVPYLKLGSGLDAYAWGWSDREEAGLPPPEGGSLAKGLMWGIPIAVALWCVLLWVLYGVLRWWR
jgi:hypothetical protein